MANYRLRIGQSSSFLLNAETGSYALSGQNATLSYAASGGTDPFPGFTSFDRNTVPFHVTSGAYGEQKTILPAPRATGGTVVNVATPSEFEVAARTANRTVRLTANIDSPVLNGGDDITNLVVDLNGFVLSRPAFLLPSNVTTNRRILFVSGATRGSFSGGQLHQPLLGGNYDSIVLDGIGLTGNGLTGGDSSNAITINGTEFVNYFEVIACRVQSGSAGFLIGHCNRFTCLGSSLNTGVLGSPPGDEAWCFRIKTYGGEGVVTAKNDLRGTRFSCVRIHPEGPSSVNYVYVGQNHFGYTVEAKAIWVNASASTPGNSATDRVTGVFFMNNLLDMQGATPQLDFNDALYVNHSSNIYYSNFYSSGTATATRAVDGLGFVNSSNTFNAERTMPSWASMQALGYGAGDPTALDWNNWES